MQRSRLKNIINKSKEVLNKPVGEPFDEFKNSLPKELAVGDNYRLEAAWKAYGSPKDFKQAVWEGMIQPISENEFKLPSIGYNEETEEYEYLNKGRENDIIAKDIRVWDNDVIPFVQELKHGGYVRTFNEAKDCWTYTKNSQKENALGENNSSVSQETGGEVNSFKQGGQMNVIPEGALHARKNNMEGAGEDFTAKGIPVVDNNGEQQAEIEKEEWTMTKELTDDVEKWYKEYYKEDTSQKDKDELAIKCGKRITKELLHNTDDRANLIAKMLEED